MAWTVYKAPSVLSAIPDASSDLDLSTYYPEGIRCFSVQFSPSDANDKLVVREGSASGPIIVKLQSNDGNDIACLLHGQWTKPYIARADCTFSTPSSVMVFFRHETKYGSWPSKP